MGGDAPIQGTGVAGNSKKRGKEEVVGTSNSKKRKMTTNRKMKVTKKKVVEKRVLAHAILVIGWEIIDEILYFDYLNTSGPTWGELPYVGFRSWIREDTERRSISHLCTSDREAGSSRIVSLEDNH